MQLFPSPGVHPDLAMAATLAVAHEQRSTPRVKVGLGQLPAPFADPVLVALTRYPRAMRHSVITTPTAETPALSDEERLERRRRFIERAFSPDGLDRDTLAHIEQLTGEER